jgi:hypothetical protein
LTVDTASRQDDRRFRRAFTALALMAVVGYIVAFVKADSGSMHYKRYVEAYTVCFEHVLEAGARQTDCNYVPEVRTHLKAHREAFAVGEPFLNLALSLTFVMLISPLIRQCVFKLVDLLTGDRDRAATQAA